MGWGQAGHPCRGRWVLNILEHGVFPGTTENAHPAIKADQVASFECHLQQQPPPNGTVPHVRLPQERDSYRPWARGRSQRTKMAATNRPPENAMDNFPTVVFVSWHWEGQCQTRAQ